MYVRVAWRGWGWGADGQRDGGTDGHGVRRRLALQPGDSAVRLGSGSYRRSSDLLTGTGYRSPRLLWLLGWAGPVCVPAACAGTAAGASSRGEASRWAPANPPERSRYRGGGGLVRGPSAGLVRRSSAGSRAGRRGKWPSGAGRGCAVGRRGGGGEQCRGEPGTGRPRRRGLFPVTAAPPAACTPGAS